MEGRILNMITIKRTYNFILDKEKGKDDCKLRLRVKWDHNKSIVAFNLGCRVDPEKWSKETSRCKTNTTHGSKKILASVINRAIQKHETVAEDVFSTFEVKDTLPTKEQFRDAFNIAIGRTQEEVKVDSFFDVFDLFIADTSKAYNWTEASQKRYSALKTRLKEFQENISLREADNTLLTNFAHYMHSVVELRNATINKRIKELTRVLKWSITKGHVEAFEFTTSQTKLKTTSKTVIYLTWEELMHLKKLEIPARKQYLERVRDVFLFLCFTGLRYSDVSNLRKSDIKPNHIEVTTIKTGDSLKIELNDYSRAIVEKYKNEIFDNNLAFPISSNQKMNDYLKELGKLAELNESIRETYYIGNKREDVVAPKYTLLSTHAGRRSFICNALILGIPANIVMKWTGHSDYKAMQPYIDIADKAKAEAMTLFNKA